MDHVKKVAREHKLSYKEAMKEASKTFERKTTQGKGVAKTIRQQENVILTEYESQIIDFMKQHSEKITALATLTGNPAIISAVGIILTFPKESLQVKRAVNNIISSNFNPFEL